LYIDVNGDSLTTNNSELFTQDMQAIYGENIKYFNIDANGNVTLKQDGFNTLLKLAIEDPNSPLACSLYGMTKVILSDEMTDITYSNDVIRDENGIVLTAQHAASGQVKKGVKPSDTGGELTLTNFDNPNQQGNKIYINPAQTHNMEVRTLKDNLTVQDIMSSNTQNITTYSIPRANNVMHGIGHVLFKSNSVQPRVIQYDNYNRALNGVLPNTDPTKTHK
jgi:hypothetical protein